MLAYQAQDSTLTLAQGLEEYLAYNAEHLSRRQQSVAAEEFFRCHDTIHVVFGCDISLADEAVVKISSLLGTTGGMAVMRGYMLPESKEIYDTLGIGLIVRTTLQSVFLVPRAMWRCLRMHKRWHWDDFDAQLDRPLSEIRAEFGLRVAHS